MPFVHNRCAIREPHTCVLMTLYKIQQIDYYTQHKRQQVDYYEQHKRKQIDYYAQHKRQQIDYYAQHKRQQIDYFDNILRKIFMRKTMCLHACIIYAR